MLRSDLAENIYLLRQQILDRAVTPTPNHILVTEYDNFEDGVFVGRWPMCHIPCASSQVGEDIADRLKEHFEPNTILSAEYSNDDGGHVMVVYRAREDMYERAAQTIISTAVALRDEKENIDSSEMYSDTVVNRVEDSLGSTAEISTEE